jgi:glycerol-3-phosphate responsive antiterminator
MLSLTDESQEHRIFFSTRPERMEIYSIIERTKKWEKFFTSQTQTHFFATSHIHHMHAYINKRKTHYQKVKL